MATTATRPDSASCARRSWRALGVDVDVLVTRPAAVEQAAVLLAEELAALDLACSRFRSDSELLALCASGGRPTVVSPLLREAVSVALQAARDTGGDVDPTLGASLVALGYDGDFAGLSSDGPRAAVTARRAVTWRDILLDEDRVSVPQGVLLDLGATAKALGADRAARRLAAVLGCGVLVNLGGDLSIAGPVPDGGWCVRVQDGPGPVEAAPDGPSQVVALRGGALATSSTTARRWQRGGQAMHHLLDPRSGLPVESPWRTVSVVASTCVAANTASTAAVVRGAGALELLRGLGAPARLVARDGRVTVAGGWPGQA